jgi:hypothetical protein
MRKRDLDWHQNHGGGVSKGTWRPGNNPAIYTVFYTSEINKLKT